MSRLRRSPHPPPAFPGKAQLDGWIDLQKDLLARVPESQQEEIRALLRAVLRRGGRSDRATDIVMEQIPPDPQAPATDDDAVLLAYPWMTTLSHADRARCLNELGDTLGTDPPRSIDLQSWRRVVSHWRRRAGA